MQLNKKQIQYLKTQAHALKPVILMGQKGLHEALLEEIDIALNTHELIKIKLTGNNRTDMQAILDTIITRSNCSLVQHIGHIASIYRHNPDAQKYSLPK